MEFTVHFLYFISVLLDSISLLLISIFFVFNFLNVIYFIWLSFIVLCIWFGLWTLNSSVQLSKNQSRRRRPLLIINPTVGKFAALLPEMMQSRFPQPECNGWSLVIMVSPLPGKYQADFFWIQNWDEQNWHIFMHFFDTRSSVYDHYFLFTHSITLSHYWDGQNIISQFIFIFKYTQNYLDCQAILQSWRERLE